VASFDFCIEQAFKDGKITKAIKNELQEADDKEAALNNITANLTEKKRSAAIQAVILANGFKNMTGHAEKLKNVKGFVSTITAGKFRNKELNGEYEGLIALMGRDLRGNADYLNVDINQSIFTNKYLTGFAEALSRFRTRRLGFEQDEKGLALLVKAIYGEAVDDPEIAEFAKQWHKLTEEIRKDFNAKGGSISKNDKWLMPQNHDADTIKKAGLDKWKESIRSKLDRSQMKDDLGKPLTDNQLEESLDFTFETITTGGLNKTKDFSVPRMGKKLASKGSEKRFLFFKDADSWMKYQRDFGRGDIFTTLTGWITSKGHDVGMMDIMGPNPDTTFGALLAQVEKTGKITNSQKAQAKALFNVISGKTNQGDLVGLSDFMQGTRNIITASTLGGAFLSALSDIGFVAITAKYNNIPAFKTLSRQLSLMNPKNEADRIFAVKIGLGAEGWLNHLHAANRYADVFGTGVTAKLSEGVMRASLLAPWTDAGRKAFGLEFSSMLADNFGKTIGELDDSVKRAFDTYGINENDWNVFRKSKPLINKGAKYADMTQEGGVKFHQMVLTETDFAVPTPDARVRSFTTGGTARASVSGQAWRSVMMLKSFPITMATTHFYRAAYQATTGDKLAYAGLLAATTTVLGGIALQAKDVAAGREPRPVDAKFFAAAFQQGGGLGIFGDFLFSDVNRFGGGISQTLFGPTGELLDTTVKFTLGNIREAVLREETNVLGETAQILKRYTPDIWQTRLFTDAVYDQITLLADPKAQKRFNKIVKRRQANYDQGYWWRPGEILPEIIK